ncbi:lipoprotein [Spiroplasma endosymbiont of Polydrusus cervinus]|uniref:lipoprotein n=1 Tax=Spiroplasma endosymbiont of Polydrusus cervinus TaxID=3066287 RepID=UPI0030D01C4E
MKKLLSILGAVGLTATSTASLVTCNNNTYNDKKEITPEELKKLKKENQINTTDENIKNNLEWIAPQEKPFNQVDNKYYFVVWRGDKNDDWRIIKFQNNEEQREKQILEDYKNFRLILHNQKVLYIMEIGKKGIPWSRENFDYFKSVYRWKLDTSPPLLPSLISDNKGNIKVNTQ